MTVTKRILKQVLDDPTIDDDAVLYTDNGVDAIEFRGIHVVESHNSENFSSKEDGSPIEPGSILLFQS
jgi:hypothetical protein